MLDRPTLIQRIDAGEHFDFLCFYGHTVHSPVTKTCFSQWYPAPFTVDGVLYPTAEHWMMAGKARLFDDEDALQRILVAPDPKSAKAIGREVCGVDEKVWKENARRLVNEGNMHKFGQNEELRTFLLSTGDAVLVEAAPRDQIWGIGLGQDNPKARDPKQWRGQNLLGFALMDVREKLRAKTLLDLCRLSRDIPGLTPALGTFHAECAAVCFEHMGHKTLERLRVDGSYRVYELSWMEVSDQMKRAHADLQRATEFGACGVAIALVQEERGEVPVQISKKGTGFDYWLCKSPVEAGELVFKNSSRLEVSGMLEGDDTRFATRMRDKLKQSIPSDATGLPAVAVVVRFSSPRAEIGTRNVYS